MHYVWTIAPERMPPSNVPDIKDIKRHENVDWAKLTVHIDWQQLDDPGNPQESKARKAAQDMVNLYGMKHIASLESNNISKIAEDMTLDGYKGKPIKKADGTTAIVSSPKELSSEIGKPYGVINLGSGDDVHWSPNGK